MMEVEVWRVISGYDGYEVSSFGRVRSLDRIVCCILSDGVQVRRCKGKVLSGERGKHYPVISIDGDCINIHRLVAGAFIPKPAGHTVVNHLDGNKRNNHVSNLEWVTTSKNIQHAYDTGLMPDKKGRVYGPRKTHCLRGHERVSSNLTSKRECRECRNTRNREKRAINKKGVNNK